MTLLLGKNGLGPSRTCIIGEAGVGKTLLAATYPKPYFLDVEYGAGSVDCPRLLVEPGPNALNEVSSELDKLKSAPVKNGVIQYEKEGQKFPVQTVVIDSIDALQQAYKPTLLRGRKKMQIQDWDTMLNALVPLILKWTSIPVHVVVVTHSRQETGEGNKPGHKTFSLQGSLKHQLPRWFDYVLHLVAGVDGKRFLITQPMISKNYQYVAKDRHNSFVDMLSKNYIPLPMGEIDKVAKRIKERHVLGNGKVKASK